MTAPRKDKRRKARSVERDIAERVIDLLFVNDSERLVVETARHLDGPGWCKRAVLDRVAGAVREVLPRKRKPK